MTLTWHECDWDNPETRPTEPGSYAVMISGDSASVDGHVLYDFPDYQTFASVWVEEGEVQIAPSHDEPAHTIFAWCGPLLIPKFDPTGKSDRSTVSCEESLDPAEIDAILGEVEALSRTAQPPDRHLSVLKTGIPPDWELNPDGSKIPKENDMAFKLASTNTSTGLDFSKLGTPKSAEEREAEYQAERVRARAEHEAKREQFATKTLDLTVTEVSSHFTRMSDRIVRLYGTDTQGRPVRAEYFIPDCYDREVADSFISRLEEGASYRLRGYWKAETVNGTKHFTFRAQFVNRKAS